MGLDRMQYFIFAKCKERDINWVSAFALVNVKLVK